MKLITKEGPAAQLRRMIREVQQAGRVVEGIELTREEFYALKNGAFIKVLNPSKDPLECWAYSFDGHPIKVVNQQGQEIHNL